MNRKKKVQKKLEKRVDFSNKRDYNIREERDKKKNKKERYKMYNEIFEKCGLTKDDGEYLREYLRDYKEGDHIDIVALWMDTDDGVDYLVCEDGNILEVSFRGARIVDIGSIERLYGVN